MIKRKDMRDKDLVRDVKRRSKRIRKEQRLIREDIGEWARRRKKITPLTIQESFGVSAIMGFAYYSQLFRDAVINQNGYVNTGNRKLRQKETGVDHGYQPKWPNEKKHYKPGVYAREITVHGFDIKPVPPAGSDAPDA